MVKFECSKCDFEFTSDNTGPVCPNCGQGASVREIPARTPKYKKPDGPPCMTPDCGKPAEWRGLCRSCYGCAKQIMEKEDLEWQDLAKMGLCNLGDKPFYVAFAKKKAEAEAKKVREQPDHISQPGVGGESGFKGPTYRG